MRAFVEGELRGIVDWDGCVKAESEASDPLEYTKRNQAGDVFSIVRRNPLGDYKEIAAIRFKDYEITVRSPEEHPPLGDIELRIGNLIDSGPIDQATWTRFGKSIREKEAGHGR